MSICAKSGTPGGIYAAGVVKIVLIALLLIFGLLLAYMFVRGRIRRR
jgi:hypothetical protein